MNILDLIRNGLAKIWNIIVSPKAQLAIAQASSLVAIALPIVQELSVISPSTAKLSEIAAAYNKYGVPLVTAYQQNPTSIGNALLNLATELLKKNLPADKANLATNILQTAVQLAVTAVKA